MPGRPAVRLLGALLLAVLMAGSATALTAGPVEVKGSGPASPVSGDRDGETTLRAAGVEVTAPLESPIIVDIDLSLPDLNIGLGGEDPAVTTTASDGVPVANADHGFGIEDVPPVAFAASGATLLALLGGAAASGMFSRIEGPEVLAHPSRARLMALVTEQPGLTILDAQELLGAAWGTTVHHVRRLEANGHIVSVRQGPRVLLYAANSPQGKARRDLALLHNDTARQVARVVVNAPGIRTTALSTTLGIATPSASKHLSRFTAAGLVERPAGGGFMPTERLHQALALA